MDTVSRYARQIILPEFGEMGQQKLASSKVLVIGCGGLGTPAATYLAMAGIGHLELVDTDTVSLTNLNRQFFYAEKDVDSYKAHVAAKVIRSMNGGISVHGKAEHIDKDHIEKDIQGFDVVLDCVDNLKTRKIVHDACLKQGIPLVEAGIDGFYGFVACIKKGGPCLNCMDFFNGTQKDVTPVLGAVAGIIGSMQALEAIKIILGRDDALFGKILYYDAKRQELEQVDIPENPACMCRKGEING